MKRKHLRDQLVIWYNDRFQVKQTKTKLKVISNTALLVFLFAFTNVIKGQSTLTTLCDVTYTNNAAQMPSQPSNCSTLLNDFVINNANDNVIEVRLRFWIFAPATSFTAGYWTKPGHLTTLADAQALCNAANAMMDNMPVPQLAIGGSPTTTTQAKIHFVPTLVYVNDDDDYYSFTSDSARKWQTWPYQDDSSINIYCGGQAGASIHSGNDGWFYIDGTSHDPSGAPFNYVIMPAQLAYWTPANPDWVNLSLTQYGEYCMAPVLIHEVGHVLGLHHTTGILHPNDPTDHGDSYSTIFPTFGCCNSIKCSDYVMETHVSTESCGTPGGSNNVMSQNSWCNKYLSPQQVAVLHYNLRVDMVNMLTPTGYAAATNVNHAFDYNVTSNETWTSDRYFKGDITVKAGKILTINCGVAMSAGAKIVVEKTAALVVNGGTITNISGRSWDGIYVWGDPAKSQALNPNNTNLAQFQGWVKLYNATISHAKIGVRNHNNPWSENGGIITAFNTNFLNNYIDIEQIGPSSTPAGLASASRFYNCNFKTNADIGDNLSPYAHVNFYRSVGAAFYGCNFEYAAGTVYTNPGYGIYSVNSKFTADKSGATPNVFKDLDRGVYVNNWNPLNVPTISNSQFINNLSYGAYFMNANTLVFQKNLVQNPGNLTSFSGVYLNNCKYYTIKSNTFTEDLNYKASVALSIYNSSAGAHQVYRNSFAKSWIGINAMGNNSGLSNIIDGLKMNCNDFTPTANLYDIALDLGNGNIAPSVMKVQGNVSAPTQTNVVRNMYAATCIGNNQNKWYIHSSSSKIVDHGCNSSSTSGASTKPTPQPACSRTIVNTATISTVLNYSLSCPETNPSSGGTGTTQAQRLSTMNGYLSELLADNTDDKNHFEIQATLASKLNLFLSDSLNNGQDSVVTLLNNNQGSMQDADIQTVFAYMAVGNYAEAQSRVDKLQNKADWATLLTKLIQVEQYDGGAMGMTATDREFFVGYATTEGKDGQSIAQALLKAGGFNSYSEPHNYPENLEGARFAGQQTLSGTGKGDGDNTLERITIYPNPTKTGINVFCNSVKEGNYKIEIQDLLGRVIYTNFITGNLIKQYVPFDGLNKGMYLITISRNDEIINKTKIIKED